jgi:hypothetical protein
MGLFFALRALHPVQDFIALVDSWSSLLLASEVRRVVEVTDDAPIFEMQLRREIELSRHAAETPGCARGSAEDCSTNYRTSDSGKDICGCYPKADQCSRIVPPDCASPNPEGVLEVPIRPRSPTDEIYDRDSQPETVSTN